MKWTELLEAVATEAGVPRREVRAVLTAFVRVTTRALAAGERVVVPDLFTADSHWHAPRTLRSVSDLRKLRLDGRFVPRLRPANRLREALLARTPQRWRDPDHQAAWRFAEALVGDLALYHATRAPVLAEDTPLTDVDGACASAFGPVWTRARERYADRVPAPVRDDTDYLATAARSRFAAP